MVPKSGKYCVRTLRAERRVKQGELVSSIAFKIVVDSVVSAVLLEVCGLREAQNGLGWAAGDHNIY